MPLDGKMAHRGGDVCVMCVLLAKSLQRGSFLFPPERTLVLSCYQLHLQNVLVLHTAKMCQKRCTQLCKAEMKHICERE